MREFEYLNRALEPGKMTHRYKMEKEAVDLAEWIINNDCTIIQLAREFGMKKSTVHRRLRITLREVDYDLWKQCDVILKRHFENRFTM